MRKKPCFARLIRRFVALMCSFLLLFAFFFYRFELRARDLIHNLVDNELELHAMNAIDKAVYDVIDKNTFNYKSLIKSDTDTNGQVMALYTDTSALNMLKAQMSLAINDNIRKSHKARVGVPAGAFIGFVLFSNFGPDVFVSLTLDGSVTTTIESEFTSAGINQTMHRVYMVVKADVSLTCPIITYETEFETTYELCQTIIVGNTPQFFSDRN